MMYQAASLTVRVPESGSVNDFTTVNRSVVQAAPHTDNADSGCRRVSAPRQELDGLLSNPQAPETSVRHAIWQLRLTRLTDTCRFTKP
jgi:hypothetical protein